VLVDNVGGPQLGAILPLLNDHGRAALVGRVGAGGEDAPVDISVAVARRLRMEGFIVLDYRAQWSSIRRGLGSLVRGGHLRPTVTMTQGLDGAPDALAGLFTPGASHLGKCLVRISG
jgi:NADPH-dependent curcumin reductase CurA